MISFTLGKYKNHNVTTDTSELFNDHVGIIGGSGGGKTVKSQDLMIQVAEAGGTVIAIDARGSLADDQIFGPYKERFCNVLNNIDVFVDGIKTELFSPIEYPDGTCEDPLDTVDSIVDLIAKTTALGIRQRADLRRAVSEVMHSGSYDTEGFKAVDDALAKIGTDTAAGVRERIIALTSHNIFRPGDNFIKRGKINVIRLSKFDCNSQIILAETVCAYLWRLANADRFKTEPIYLFIDECQNMPSGKDSMLAQMLSEGRRFGVNLIVATQLLLDSSFSAVQQRFTQCGLLLFFKPLSNRIDQTSRMIDPAAKADWTLTLRTLKVGEFVACGSFLVSDHKCERPLKIDGRVDFSKEGKNRSYYMTEKSVNGVSIEVKGDQYG